MIFDGFYQVLFGSPYLAYLIWLIKGKFLRIKKKDKQVSKSYKLNFKKQILFEFLNDLNHNILCDEMTGIKEILIKEIQISDKKKKAKLLHDMQSVEATVTSQASTVIEEFEFEELYYGLYNPMDKLGVHFANFKERIVRFNNRTKDTLDEEQDSMEFDDEAELEPVVEKKKKVYVFQKGMYVHRTHFSQLMRKVLFEKFQKMGIWTRQTFSQDNEKIFLLLKLQSRESFVCGIESRVGCFWMNHLFEIYE